MTIFTTSSKLTQGVSCCRQTLKICKLSVVPIKHIFEIILSNTSGTFYIFLCYSYGKNIVSKNIISNSNFKAYYFELSGNSN